MKIKEQVLTIEQMKYLQDLGVDTSDASMQYRLIHDVEEPPYWELEIHEQDAISFDDEEDVIYTYTIGDLIEKLPKSIDIGYEEYNLEILIKWEYTVVCYTNSRDYCPFSYSQSSLIESLYGILCMIAENRKELLEVKK